MTRYPAAYIRRSVADTGNPGDVSRDVQEAAVRALAHADGHNGDVRLFVDWARSADEEKEAKRTEFRAMLAEIEAGHIEILYAYSLDRLARSTNTFARLLKAAKVQDVRVVTQREGDLSDNGNPMSWAFGFLVSFFAEFELRMAKARSQSAAERRHARGDAWGYAPFGFVNARSDAGAIVRVPDPERPVEPVLAAYREAGTILGAARLLRERGIPAPRGGERWSTFTVGRILEANAPDLLPRRTATGRRQPSPKALLAGLLRCHCGGVLTPNVARAGYYCWKGRDGGPAHGKYNAQEAAILPWVMVEAARLSIPTTDEGVPIDDAEGRRTAVEEAYRRAGKAFAAGAIDDEEFEAAQRRHVEDMATLADRPTFVEVPDAIDWGTDDPADINRALRELWRFVELDATMQPVRAEWRVPQWRRA